MSNREPRAPGGSRRIAILAAGVVVVGVAIGLGVALGGGPAGVAPTATPAIGSVASAGYSDLPMVTVAPTASPLDTGSATPSPLDTGSATPSPLDTGSVAASPTPAGAIDGGIPANRIRIARLRIDLAIIEGDGLDAPIGKVAHYPGSLWPGGGSNIYIYGHAREGMFITLWKAHVGDTVELDLVDGTSRTYVVTKVLPKVPFDAVQYLQPTKTEQLTLQTSTSYYPTAPRFVVIAVPRT